MDMDSQNKVERAGFIILRKDDYPTPRIKVRSNENGGWKTYKKFETKAERDRAFALFLKDEKTISD